MCQEMSSRTWKNKENTNTRYLHNAALDYSIVLNKIYEIKFFFFDVRYMKSS